MKLLILLARVPHILDKGDKLRAFYQIQQLAEKHEITLFALAGANDSLAEATQALRPYCRHIYFYPLTLAAHLRNLARAGRNDQPFQVNYFYDRRAQQQVNQIIARHQPDHIYCQLVRMAEYVRHVKNIPKTLDYMDAFSAGMARRAAHAPFYLKPIFQREAKRLQQYEAAVFNDFSRKIIISCQDRAAIAHPRRAEITVVPNGVPTPYFQPPPLPKSYELVFTGNLSYAPNVAAAVFLVKKVLPLLKKQFPRVRLLLAGAHPGFRVRALRSAHVTVSGWLPDLRVAYASAQILVAPLFTGSGLQNKILEAMALRVPCITSPLVSNGVGATDHRHLLVARSAAEFAQGVSRLLTDRILAQQLTDRAAAFVQENYNWPQANALLEQVLNTAPAPKCHL